MKGSCSRSGLRFFHSSHRTAKTPNSHRFNSKGLCWLKISAILRPCNLAPEQIANKGECRLNFGRWRGWRRPWPGVIRVAPFGQPGNAVIASVQAPLIILRVGSAFATALAAEDYIRHAAPVVTSTMRAAVLAALVRRGNIRHQQLVHGRHKGCAA